MIDRPNPFALARASDFTDKLINSLWVELGKVTIKSVIEPTSKISKFILGGKGTGKTHLLRYYSYPAAKLRSKNESGLSVIVAHKFLAIFLRATGIDAARFESSSDINHKWQYLFGVYLELRLVEGVLDALIDVASSTPSEEFNDLAFIKELSKSLVGADLSGCHTIKELRSWVLNQKRQIDDAVNNAAFSGVLEVRIPFSLGAFCLPISNAMEAWNSQLAEIPLIYLIDEIENFSESQQQVVNTLVRYGEGRATFRVTGRLYSRKTDATLADGEENREDAEFKTEILDDILRSYRKYPEFAEKFVKKRLSLAGMVPALERTDFKPADSFKDIDASNFYSNVIAELGVADGVTSAIKSFSDALETALKERFETVGQDITDCP